MYYTVKGRCNPADNPIEKLNSINEEKSYEESATQSEKEDTLQGDSTTKLV